MYTRKRNPAWLGILVLSGMFIVGHAGCKPPDGEYPTGAYLGEEDISVFNLDTTSGVVTGHVTDPGDCLTDFTVSGTSIGSLVTLSVQADDMATECCNRSEFSLTANEDRTVLEGTLSYSPESNCANFPDVPFSMTLME